MDDEYTRCEGKRVQQGNKTCRWGESREKMINQNEIYKNITMKHVF